MRLVTTETVSEGSVRHGQAIFASAVSGANVLRDMREAITNTIGGTMTRYEALVDETIARALSMLAERAREQGYDGVLAVRISHPVITQGAVTVVVCGTGFWFHRPQS
jgi:uncharacterized protein YbjQ (UPF0145 family)